MGAGIQMGEGSELAGLRLAGGICAARTRHAKDEDGVWRFKHYIPEDEEIVGLFGSLQRGDMVAPHPVMLSREAVSRGYLARSGADVHFMCPPAALFVLVDVQVQELVFSFYLLSASAGADTLVWYHLPKRKVTEMLMHA